VKNKKNKAKRRKEKWHKLLTIKNLWIKNKHL
jgi:hypothetical protein